MDLGDLNGALIALGFVRPKDYIYSPLTGATIVAPPDATMITVKPAGTIAALAVVLPSFPKDQASVLISSSQTVTALTVSCVGKTVIGPVRALSSIASAEFIYVADDNAWYPA
jgi:hypothetical protein